MKLLLILAIIKFPRKPGHGLGFIILMVCQPSGVI